VDGRAFLGFAAGVSCFAKPVTNCLVADAISEGSHYVPRRILFSHGQSPQLERDDVVQVLLSTKSYVPGLEPIE
jgi:hypothetical protein